MISLVCDLTDKRGGGLWLYSRSTWATLPPYDTSPEKTRIWVNQSLSQWTNLDIVSNLTLINVIQCNKTKNRNLYAPPNRYTSNHYNFFENCQLKTLLNSKFLQIVTVFWKYYRNDLVISTVERIMSNF